MTTVLLVGDGDTAVLECQVNANPLGVERLITWSRPGYDMSRAVIEAPSVDRSRLRIAGVERLDAGTFHCNAFNGIGDVSTAVAQLVVKCESISFIILFIFSFHGPTVWNSLPSALRDDSLSLNTFSRRLKTYLFGQ